MLDGISAMLAMYQETIRSILDQSDHPGISAEELDLFKSQFRASAFTCRLKSCPRATLGFETEKACFEHEMTHVRRFRCTFPRCHFPPFVSAQALKNHVNKSHNPNPVPQSIRDIQIPSALRRAPTCRDEGDKPMQKRREKSSPMPSAHSNATKLKEDDQTLSRRANRPSQRVIDLLLNSRRQRYTVTEAITRHFKQQARKTKHSEQARATSYFTMKLNVN